MSGTFANERHAAILASFLETWHTLLVWVARAAFGTDAEADGSHAATTLAPARAATAP